jgi:ABC-type polysaccharide/polyol phosphate export permease
MPPKGGPTVAEAAATSQPYIAARRATRRASNHPGTTVRLSSTGDRLLHPGLLPAAVRPLAEVPLRKPRVWMTLAWMDIVQNYRRTMLGPVWITLNLVVFTVAMTVVYGAIFGLATPEYASYLLCGMMVWMWVSALLNEMGHTFINNGPALKSTAIDKSLFVWAAVHRQAIIFAHHLPVYLALVLLQVVHVTPYTLLAIPAFAILYLLSVPVCALAAILFARYRDLPRLIGSAFVVLMMITPVFWQVDMITGWKTLIYHFNPLYYLVEFVRAPMLGRAPDPIVTVVVLALAAVLWVAGATLYRRYEKYVVFWV